MATNSFYVPASQTGSYVEQKRDASGTKLYAGQESEIGIQKQAALQNLSEQYNQTIQNAYESYLANEGKIRLSQMGQGYKEAYEQKANEAFMQNIAEANQTAANARAQIETSAAEQQTALQERYKQEVANLDRAAASMEDYLTYVKSLRGKTEEGKIDDTLRYFDEEQEKLSAADLYDKLLDAQPQSLYDEEGLAGQSYTDWLRSKYTKGTKEDSAWLQYMYGGGLSDFKRAAYQSSIDRRNQAERISEEKAQQEEQLKKATIPGYVGNAGERKNDKYIINGKEYSTHYLSKNLVSSSKIRNAIRDKYDVDERLKTGELVNGDILEYDDKYYVIDNYGDVYELIDFNKSDV